VSGYLTARGFRFGRWLIQDRDPSASTLMASEKSRRRAVASRQAALLSMTTAAAALFRKRVRDGPHRAGPAGSAFGGRLDDTTGTAPSAEQTYSRFRVVSRHSLTNSRRSLLPIRRVLNPWLGQSVSCGRAFLPRDLSGVERRFTRSIRSTT
jgi:hypothetical protein